LDRKEDDAKNRQLRGRTARKNVIVLGVVAPTVDPCPSMRLPLVPERSITGLQASSDAGLSRCSSAECGGASA